MENAKIPKADMPKYQKWKNVKIPKADMPKIRNSKNKQMTWLLGGSSPR